MKKLQPQFEEFVLLIAVIVGLITILQCCGDPTSETNFCMETCELLKKCELGDHSMTKDVCKSATVGSTCYAETFYDLPQGLDLHWGDEQTDFAACVSAVFYDGYKNYPKPFLGFCKDVKTAFDVAHIAMSQDPKVNCLKSIKDKDAADICDALVRFCGVGPHCND